MTAKRSGESGSVEDFPYNCLSACKMQTKIDMVTAHCVDAPIKVFFFAESKLRARVTVQLQIVEKIVWGHLSRLLPAEPAPMSPYQLPMGNQ